jgi:hypothetical protein
MSNAPVANISVPLGNVNASNVNAGALFSGNGGGITNLNGNAITNPPFDLIANTNNYTLTNDTRAINLNGFGSITESNLIATGGVFQVLIPGVPNNTVGRIFAVNAANQTVTIAGGNAAQVNMYDAAGNRTVVLDGTALGGFQSGYGHRFASAIVINPPGTPGSDPAANFGAPYGLECYGAGLFTNGLTVGNGTGASSATNTYSVITNNGIVWIAWSGAGTIGIGAPNGSLLTTTNGNLFVRSTNTWHQIW